MMSKERKERGKEEEEVDATGVTSMLLLAARQRRRWKKSPKRSEKSPNCDGNRGTPAVPTGFNSSGRVGAIYK